VSSSGTRRRLAAAERRRLIEQAATRLFAERGYANTTVDDIVSAAGVTKPMLYRHFESKQELCITLLERYRDELIAAPLAKFRPGASDREAQLAAMIDAWLAHVEHHPDAARMLFTPVSGDAEVERVQRRLHRRQADTQAALLREFEPTLDEVEAEPLGDVVRAGFAAVALWRLDHPETPREAPASVLLRLVDGILSTLTRAAGAG
jgi:AcrR family transcriptional regulator